MNKEKDRVLPALGYHLLGGTATGIFLAMVCWSLGVPLYLGAIYHCSFLLCGLFAGALGGGVVFSFLWLASKIAGWILPRSVHSLFSRIIFSMPLLAVIYIPLCLSGFFILASPLMVYDNEFEILFAAAKNFLICVLVFIVLGRVMFFGETRLFHRVLLVFLFLGGAGSGIFFMDRSPGPASRVILVTIDTIRADHVGCYGYPRETTPFLDGLARKGAVFLRAYCPTPVTDPAHVSMLTGLYPRTTGVIFNGYPADISVGSIAQELSESGYATAAVTSRVHLDPGSLEIPGFEYISSPLPRALDTPASEATRRAGLWLRRHRRGPIFLWVHYWDPHSPYYPPEEFRRRLAPSVRSRGQAPVWLDKKGALDQSLVSDLTSLYDGEIAYVDSELERLYRFTHGLFGDASSVLWVFAGDHGEIMGEIQDRYPYGFGHGDFLYEPAVRVPWIIFGGPVSHSVIIETPVSTVDMSPTILSLLGLSALEPCQGVSLAGLVRGEKTKPEPRPIIFERWLPSGGPIPLTKEPLYGIIQDDMKWLGNSSGHEELYDLQKDPEEIKNLVVESAETAEKMRELWKEWSKRHPTTKPRSDRVLPVTVRDLRALGYFQ